MMTLEQELILKAQKNDVAAFEELVSIYTKSLLNYIYRMLKNREDAEDALQETYLKVYNSLKNFEGNSSFKTWLYRIATNVCLDKIRKDKKVNSQSLSQTTEEGEYELQIPDETYSPEISANKSAAMKALTDAVEKLSSEHRTVVTLRDMQGLSYDEIAEATQSTIGTVKSRLSRARLQLKKLLEKDRELFS